MGVLAVLAATLCCAPVASAYIRNVRLIDGADGGTLAAKHSYAVTAPAPGNPTANTDFPLGGGAAILNGDGKQAVSSALVADKYPPYSAPWTIGGISLDPPTFWGIDGFAYWAEASAAAPATVAEGANYVKQVKLVTKTSDLNSKDKAVAAVCPDGKNVISGGGRIVGGGSKVGFAELGGPATQKFRVVAREVVSTSRLWGVVAYAFCANYTTQATGNVYASTFSQKLETTPNDSTDVKTVEAGCGAAGGTAIGGGAGTLETSDKVALIESRPKDGKWVATARELTPEAGNWSLEVRVHCSVLGQSGPPG
jgi:hypothetical protein